MGLRYGGKIVDDYSAMQGPCPDGFHVPTYNEVTAFYDTITALGFTNTGESAISLQSCLKLSLPGAISRYASGGGNPQNVGGAAYVMICCQKSSTTSKMRRTIIVTNTSITSSGDIYVGQGYTFRPVKNTPVIPDSSWITQFDGSSISQGAGIFWNQTLGVISLSSDGTNWITISDKNCGATQVYSSGDPITQANSGYFYQWGNNYGFPLTGPVNKTTTQANAGGYAPSTWNNDVYIYGNTNWSSVDNLDLWGGVTGVQQGPAPIKKRYYGGKMVDDYSAMRGPCPDGFHVPIRDELTTLYSYMNTLGLADTGANFKEKLLLPNASKLAQNTGQRESYSTYAYLRSCNSYNTFGARTIQISNSKIYHGNNDFNSKSGGDTIRPFKDTSVSPDSSWTALYDGSSVAAGAGVFHNESLGLISVSSDGINWITLADKNLGATVAYNVGDTLSEANCGKFYQWGNNYGFPWTGATTTSSTKVDASNYGPGNYYSSSTFIIAENASSSTAWDTTNNPNLRGGETGVQQRPAEVIKVYKGNTLIREKS